MSIKIYKCLDVKPTQLVVVKNDRFWKFANEKDWCQLHKHERRILANSYALLTEEEAFLEMI